MTGRGFGRRTQGYPGSVIPRWRWLLLALAAVTIGCLVPGSMISQTLSASSRTAAIETAAPTPTGSECAAVSCTRGGSSAPLPVFPVALAGVTAAGALFVLLALRARRTRTTAEALPEGNPLRLLHPPQLTFSL